MLTGCQLLGVINLLDEKPGTLQHAATLSDAHRIADAYRDAGFAAVDLGAQSSHYAVRRLGVQEEVDRLVPFVEALAADGHAVSVETGRAEVVRAATTAGATTVNLSSGTTDPEVVAALVSSGATVITAFTPNDSPHEVEGIDVARDFRGKVEAGLLANIAHLRAAGVGSLIADAGIGFSFPVPYEEFSHYQVETIRQTRALADLVQLPVLVAVPRLPNPWLTAAFTTLALENGAAWLRCHDTEVALVLQLLTRGVPEQRPA